jgi:hypothetical protein
MGPDMSRASKEEALAIPVFASYAGSAPEKMAVVDARLGIALVSNMPDTDQSTEDFEAFSHSFNHWVYKVKSCYEHLKSVYDVFVSFSGEEESFARQASDFLTIRGRRVFFSRESISQLAQG